MSCARSIPNCIRRRSLTLSCINLGMSHNMLFYIRSMIYLGIDCLQSCDLEKGFCFMAMMLNAKDVYPSWQNLLWKHVSQWGQWLPSGCSKIVCPIATFRDDYTHLDVVLRWRARVKIWICAEVISQLPFCDLIWAPGGPCHLKLILFACNQFALACCECNDQVLAVSFVSFVLAV